MNVTRRSFLALASMGALGMLAGCTDEGDALLGSAADGESPSALPSGALAFDAAAWRYDADNDVYWQVGIVYCEKPAAEAYESLGVYVPGAYLTGEDNGDGTFTCAVNGAGSVGAWTAVTAPIVMPVNTAGYSAQPAPTGYSYESVADYLEAGFVYVYAGCRGRDNGYNDDGSLAFSGGAPWGVTDLKAAVRYVRYNAMLLPGNVEAVFAFGHSGGGAQSALMGATGDSDLYEPYLESIGAAMASADGGALSDAIAGAMCWCPITCLDQADAAYEWMMGQYADTGTRADGTWTAALSSDLSEAYAQYVNELELKDGRGENLFLEPSSEGLYASGTYYEHVLGLIEESLNNFLHDTEFPYEAGGQTMADGGFGGGLNGAPEIVEGELPSDGAPGGVAPDGAADGAIPQMGELQEGEAPSGMQGGAPGSPGADGAPGGSGAADVQTTFETAQEYIDSLNADEAWVSYDATSNTVSVASVGAFVRHCKAPSKDVGAFDAVDRSQAENKLFGNDESNELHFDETMARLLEENATGYAELTGWDASLPAAYAGDRALFDSLGIAMDVRAAMYNPLYYLCSGYEGIGASSIAPHWRIRSGIEQGDTSLTVEANLALALAACKDVDDVDFATVWGQGHTTAERTGDSTANFIAWVESCLKR